MAINPADFAEECVRQGLYCGVNPHYMLGVAQLRSGITEDSKGDEIGTFRLKQTDWNANCNDNEFDFHFLPSDIKDWDMQCPVFALMAHRAFDAFVLKNNRNPSAKELYLQQWPDTPAATISTDLGNALAATVALVDPAAKKVLNEPQPPPLIINNPDQPAPGPSAGPFQLGVVPRGRDAIAQKILNAFAGLGKFQQATALANAIAESALNPNAHAAVGEDSWGLFQLNRKGGLGTGHNPDELVNPDRNIAIVLAEASKYAEFTKAASLSQAVSAFVRDVERPSNIPGEIINRLKIAQKILP